MPSGAFSVVPSPNVSSRAKPRGPETVARSNGIVQKRPGALAVIVPDRSLARRSRGTGMAGGGSGAASRPCPMGTGCPRYDESQGVVGGRGRPACPLVPRSGSGKTNKAWVPVSESGKTK